jgi:hypothetical protein
MNNIKTTDLILIIILMMGLINGLTSCSSTKIAHTPTKREIKRAMKYSTSEYIMPYVQTNISQVYDPHQ